MKHNLLNTLSQEHQHKIVDESDEIHEGIGTIITPMSDGYNVNTGSLDPVLLGDDETPGSDNDINSNNQR